MRFALAAFSTALLAALAGCGSPPEVADAAFSIGLVPSSAGSCSVGSDHTEVGMISATTFTPVKDGANGATLDCTVAGSDSFNIDASYDLGSESFRIIVKGLKPTATIDAPATGFVSYFSTKAVSGFQGNCSFYFANKTQTVTPGKVWVTFSCDALNGGDGMSTCAVTQAVAAFEHCLTVDDTSM